MVRKASGKISGRTIKWHFWEGTPLMKHRVLLPACTRTWHEFTYPQQGTGIQSLIYFWVGSPLLETVWGSMKRKQEVTFPLSNQYLHWNFARWVLEGTGPTHGYRHSSSSEISPPGIWENTPASCATNMYLKLKKKSCKNLALHYFNESQIKWQKQTEREEINMKPAPPAVDRR